MTENIDILKNSPLFEGIAISDLSRMLTCLGAKRRDYRKGESILREGDPATHMGILYSGNARTERIDYEGNRTIVSPILSGELFAESFACAGVDHLPVTITATEDCQVLFLECGCIAKTCSNACVFHQQMIFNLLKITARQTISLHQRAEITSHRTTRDKLLAYLNQQAKKHQTRKFTIPFDRQQLADFLEVDRSGLSAEISKLRKEGILDSRKSEFELL